MAGALPGSTSVWRVTLLLLVGVGIPCVTLIAFLGLVGRLKYPSLALAIPLLALGATVCVATAVTLLVPTPGSLNTLMRQLCWPHQIGFTTAGFALLVAVWFLRRRGVVFAYGAGNDPDWLASVRSNYVSSVRRRIAKNERARVRLQSQWEALNEADLDR